MKPTFCSCENKMQHWRKLRAAVSATKTQMQNSQQLQMRTREKIHFHAGMMLSIYACIDVCVSICVFFVFLFFLQLQGNRYNWKCFVLINSFVFIAINRYHSLLHQANDVNVRVCVLCVSMCATHTRTLTHCNFRLCDCGSCCCRLLFIFCLQSLSF